MPASALDRLHILIVDDHAELRALLRTMLLEMGLGSVDMAAEGGEAYRKFVDAPAGLVLADLHMKPLDGIALTRMIRTARDTPNAFVPVMLISGDTDHNTVMEARDAGANDFLCRPFSGETLFAHIVKVIEKPRHFIKTREFFGPDRRHQAKPIAGFDRRRGDRNGHVVEYTGAALKRAATRRSAPSAARSNGRATGSERAWRHPDQAQDDSIRAASASAGARITHPHAASPSSGRKTQAAHSLLCNSHPSMPASCGWRDFFEAD
jgi:DNA-binding response OmpR family regulator